MLEDYIDIVRRHRAWLIGPLLAGFVIAVVTAYVWPDTFISQAVLRITPPQIPENLVTANFNIQMAERISQMQQEILSRESLSELIQRQGPDLYKKERSRMPMADLVEEIRKNIQITVVDQQIHGGRPASMFPNCIQGSGPSQGEGGGGSTRFEVHRAECEGLNHAVKPHYRFPVERVAQREG